MLFILLDAAQADIVRGPTVDGSALDPQEAMAGDHAGKFLLPARVIADPDHAEHKDFLSGLPQAEIIPSDAWPPEA